MTRLPRILYAVPPLPHVHLEIAKAILASSNDGALDLYNPSLTMPPATSITDFADDRP